jgi:RsiW-degrading membrane proteinase PrsW (M82 family)
MKIARQSAFIVVAVYLIILVSLLIGVSIDPSEGGLGWVMFLFVLGGTPIFLVLAVIAYFIGFVVSSIKDKKNRDTTTS